MELLLFKKANLPFLSVLIFLFAVRKPKGLQITKNMTRLADLKVAQIASVLSQVHSCLTSQCLFTCGGELVEIHRKNLTSLKAHDDGSEAGLRARITASQKLQWAEKRWRDRLVSLFKEGRADIRVYSVECTVFVIVATLHSVYVLFALNLLGGLVRGALLWLVNG